MKNAIVFILSLLPFATFAAKVTLTEQDQQVIKKTANDYANGWYSGDKQRMASSLHPNLAKRAYIPTADGKRKLLEMNAEILVAGTVKENAEKYAHTTKLAEVEILDGFGQVATVKLQMNDWVDYLHMVRMENGEWRIMNVLWEFNENYGR